MVLANLHLSLFILLIYSSLTYSAITWAPTTTFSIPNIQQKVYDTYEKYQTTTNKRSLNEYWTLPPNITREIREILKKYTPKYSLIPQDVSTSILPPIDKVKAFSTYLDVPLNYSGGTTTIKFFAKKYAALNGVSDRTVILNQGGPGASGVALELYVLNMMVKMPNADFIIPDHRGSGRSTRLGCSYELESNLNDYGRYVEDAYLISCIKEIETKYPIKHFSTTNAARDLGFLVSNLTGPVTVYGVSYGTYLVNRFMQIFPTYADSIVLDGVCPPNTCNLPAIASRFGEGLKNFFLSCNANSFCKDKFGGNAVTVWENFKNKDGTCGPFSSFAEIETFIINIIDDPYFWPLLMPMLFRVNRCKIEDSGALEVVFAAISSAPASPYPKDTTPFPQPWASSDVLFDIITYSELYHYTTADKTFDISKQAFFPIDVSSLTDRYQSYVSNGYIYNDPLANQYPSNPPKILILNGDLDVRTPLSWAQAYDNGIKPFSSNEQFSLFNNSAHGTISPENNPTKGNFPCAVDMMGDWIYGSVNNVNTHPCKANIRPYYVSSEAAQAFLDVYGVKGFTAYEGGALPGYMIAIIVILIILVVAIIGALVVHFVICK